MRLTLNLQCLSHTSHVVDYWWAWTNNFLNQFFGFFYLIVITRNFNWSFSVSSIILFHLIIIFNMQTKPWLVLTHTHIFGIQAFSQDLKTGLQQKLSVGPKVQFSPGGLGTKFMHTVRSISVVLSTNLLLWVFQNLKITFCSHHSDIFCRDQ